MANPIPTPEQILPEDGFIDGVPIAVFDLENTTVGDEFPECDGFVEGELRTFRVRARSGRILNVIRSRDVIGISDADDSTFTFSAARSGDRISALVMKNAGWEGDPNKKHPDLYPVHKLMERALEYFAQYGDPITAIYVNYNKSEDTDLSDNIRAYNAAMDEILLEHGMRGKQPRPWHQYAAVRRTPTGKMFDRLGYANISGFTDADLHVIGVTFSRNGASI